MLKAICHMESESMSLDSSTQGNNPSFNFLDIMKTYQNDKQRALDKIVKNATSK